MSPQAGELLVQEIAPRIRSSLTHCVSQVGPDDIDELVQDAIATAAKLLHSVRNQSQESHGGQYQLLCGAPYPRGQAQHRVQEDRPAAPGRPDSGPLSDSIAGEPLGGEIEDQETLCLHDVLAAGDEDPSMAATRRLDWAEVVESLDPPARRSCAA